jgi:hypothetical protein
LSTYVEIVLPWREGTEGFGVPGSMDLAQRAVDLALAFARPDLESIFIEQPPLDLLAFAVPRVYGPRDVSEIHAEVTGALNDPQHVGGVPVPRTWVVSGCTITTHHPATGVPAGELCLMMQLPFRANEAVALMVNEDRAGVELQVMGNGWEAEVEGLTLRIWPVDPREAIDYHDLYAPDAFDAPYLWVSSVGANTCGLGTSIHASAPILRPVTGGYLEFYSQVLQGIRNPVALTHALRKRPLRGFVPWLITRTSALVGWVAMPSALATGSRADVLAYLHSPQSMDAGWVDLCQRFLGDSGDQTAYSVTHSPGFGLVVADTFVTGRGTMRVTIDVVASRTPGHAPWWWLRLTTRGAEELLPRAVPTASTAGGDASA